MCQLMVCVKMRQRWLLRLKSDEEGGEQRPWMAGEQRAFFSPRPAPQDQKPKVAGN